MAVHSRGARQGGSRLPRTSGSGRQGGARTSPRHPRLRGLGGGQLENEIKQNAWLTVEAKDGIIFDTPTEERLPAAMKLLGIDFARLSEEAGHA